MVGVSSGILRRGIDGRGVLRLAQVTGQAGDDGCVVFDLRSGTFMRCELATRAGVRVRLAVTLCLIVATVCGPALCCCAGRHDVGRGTSVANRHPPTHSCCQKGKPAEGRSTTASLPADESPTPQTPCPCSDASTPVAAAAAESRQPVAETVSAFDEAATPNWAHLGPTGEGRPLVTLVRLNAASARPPLVLRC